MIGVFLWLGIATLAGLTLIYILASLEEG